MSRSRLVVIVCLAAPFASGLACGDGGSPKPGRDEPSLGRGPWTTDEVAVFLRPAYDSMAADLGVVVSFACAQGGPPGFAPSTTPEDRIFQCTVAFQRGRAGGRVMVFDDRGALEREIDLPAEYSVNPDIPCTTEPEIDETLPDCAAVPVQIEAKLLPRTDHALFGSRPMPGKRGAPVIGEPENPADCGEVDGEIVQAVRHPCSEARELAALVGKHPPCKPPREGDTHGCVVKEFTCTMNANGDDTKPWSVSCSLAPEENEDADSIGFYVPATLY